MNANVVCFHGHMIHKLPAIADSYEQRIRTYTTKEPIIVARTHPQPSTLPVKGEPGAKECFDGVRVGDRGLRIGFP